MRFIILLILSAVVAACGGKVDRSAPNTATGTPSTVGTSDAVASDSRVTVNSPDGVQIIGTFFSASKPESPALLLLHQWASDRHSYDEFAKQMHEKGFAVLSIDGRGFGESIKKADGSSVAAGRTDADVKAMLGDVDAAFTFLTKQRNVDKHNIAILGASYGSSLAILYAEQNHDVRNVVLVSPGLNYFGNMPIEPPISHEGERWLYVIAAEDDKESANTVRKLDVRRKGPNMIDRIYPAGGHGTSLLRVEGVRKDLESYLGSMISNPVRR